MADRGRQMRLAEPDAAVNEKRVIFLSRLVGHRQGCRMGELIARADHKLGEGVAPYQLRMEMAALRVGRAGRRSHGCGKGGSGLGRVSIGGGSIWGGRGTSVFILFPGPAKLPPFSPSSA